jgi:hypothetical protein
LERLSENHRTLVATGDRASLTDGEQRTELRVGQNFADGLVVESRSRGDLGGGGDSDLPELPFAPNLFAAGPERQECEHLVGVAEDLS